MPESVRDKIYHMRESTIAKLCGSARFEDIEAAVDAAIEEADNRGILDSYDWNSATIRELFKREA